MILRLQLWVPTLNTSLKLSAHSLLHLHFVFNWSYKLTSTSQILKRGIRANAQRAKHCREASKCKKLMDYIARCRSEETSHDISGTTLPKSQSFLEPT